MLDSGQARSQADIARIHSVSRAKVTQMMNLLKLDQEIRDYIVGLDDTDKRLKGLTERRLRPLSTIEDMEIQKLSFWTMVKG